MPALRITEAMRLAEKYGIKFAKFAEVKTETELKKEAEAIGYPIAMKIVSSQISHKTERGGVKINLANYAEAKRAFVEMKALEGFESVIIQEMLRGTEIIIGGKRDVQFGPTVLFGLGGIYVEVFKDFSLGICPIKSKDAKKMMKSLKSYPILEGARGKKGVNLEKIEEALLKTSKMMMAEKILELDMNPLVATSKDVVAVDARVIISGDTK